MWSISLEGGPRRVNHAAVAVRNQIYSFGGYCSGEGLDPEEPIDVHVLNTETFRWRQIKSKDTRDKMEVDVSMESDDEDDFDRLRLTGARPFPYQRYGHTVVEYGGKIYLWGGRNDEYGASSILHEFDPVTCQWDMVTASGKPPPARDGHSAVIWQDEMFIFGGFEEDAQRFSQETFVFNFVSKSWREMKTFGSPPIWRDFHTAVVLGQKMYVFGGRSDQMGQYHSTRDVYCDRLKALDLLSGEWSDPSSNGNKPCGRRSHSAWTFENRMYVFGGYLGTQNKHYNDLFSYNPTTGNWEKVEPLAPRGGPSERRRQCTVVVGDRLFLFGGTRPGNGTTPGLADLADLHVLDYHPSLYQICANTVVHTMDLDYINQYLPRDISRHLYNITTPNDIANPLQQRHEVAG